MCHIVLDNFYQQDTETQGVVCVFSLKNPSYPEYLCLAQCGVLCLDIHPQHPHMLVAGLSNGNVAVYNLQKKIEGRPSYISTARNGKHQDAVGQVCVLKCKKKCKYFFINIQILLSYNILHKADILCILKHCFCLMKIYMTIEQI